MLLIFWIWCVPLPFFCSLSKCIKCAINLIDLSGYTNWLKVIYMWPIHIYGICIVVVAQSTRLEIAEHLIKILSNDKNRLEFITNGENSNVWDESINASSVFTFNSAAIIQYFYLFSLSIVYFHFLFNELFINERNHTKSSCHKMRTWITETKSYLFFAPAANHWSIDLLDTHTGRENEPQLV